MRYQRLWNRLYNMPLMLHPEKAVMIEEIFRARVLGHSLPTPHIMEDGGIAIPKPAAYNFNGKQKPYSMTPGRIAMLPVVGTLIQRGNWMDAMSGLTSYGSIADFVLQSESDPDVTGRLMEVDTFGGEAFGMAGLAEIIYISAQKKPLWVHINEQAYSAGYGISAPAGKIFIPRSGATGSIGTIALHVDQSKRDAQQGYNYTFVYSGAHKKDFNSHEPLSDHALSVLQSEVDRHRDMFAQGVDRYRELAAGTAYETEAALFAPQDAVDIGLVDGIATFAETLAMLEDDIRAGNNFYPGMRTAAHHSSTSRKECTMFTQAQLDAAVAAATTKAVSETTAAVTKSVTESVTASVTEAVTAKVTKDAAISAAAAERGRIGAILGSEEAKGRGKLAAHLALETDTSADAAKKLLAASAKEAETPANPFAAAMAKIANPSVGTDPEAKENDTPAAAAASILGAYTKAGGRASAKENIH